MDHAWMASFSKATHLREFKRKKERLLHMRHLPGCFCEKDIVKEHSTIQPVIDSPRRKLHLFKENSQKKDQERSDSLCYGANGPSNKTTLIIIIVLKPVNPKGKQPWIFIGNIHAEAPIFWPPDAKSWLIRKDPDAQKDWRQEEKGTTEDEMVGWHPWVNGHGFE